MGAHTSPLHQCGVGPVVTEERLEVEVISGGDVFPLGGVQPKLGLLDTPLHHVLMLADLVVEVTRAGLGKTSKINEWHTVQLLAQVTWFRDVKTWVPRVLQISRPWIFHQLPWVLIQTLVWQCNFL